MPKIKEEVGNIEEVKNLSQLELVLAKISMSGIEVPKDCENTQGGKTYKYSSLPSYQRVLNKELPKHGIVYRFQQGATSDGIMLSLHVYSEASDNSCIYTAMINPIQGQSHNEYQSAGEGLTYYSKYLLRTAFNLISDDDNDADVAQIKQKILKENTKEYISVLTNMLTISPWSEALKEVKTKYVLTQQIETKLRGDYEAVII